MNHDMMDDFEYQFELFPKNRKPLPTPAVEVLKAWLFSPQHVAYPYPTSEEIKSLMIATGLNSKQLKNWFTNARRRIWKKYNDSCGPSSPGKLRKSKKQKLETEEFVFSPPGPEEQLQTTTVNASEDVCSLSQMVLEKIPKRVKPFSEDELSDVLSVLLNEENLLCTQSTTTNNIRNISKSTNCFDDFEFQHPPSSSTHIFADGQEISGIIMDSSYAFTKRENVSPSKVNVSTAPAPNVPATSFVKSLPSQNKDVSRCLVCNHTGAEVLIKDCSHSFHANCLRIASLFFSDEEILRCPSCFTGITSCNEITKIEDASSLF